MNRAVNVHGTAIVIGTTGLLFVGPSGSGKTTSALCCIGSARARGLFAALVADDQVMVSVAGAAVVARAPKAITGLAEVRGSGIVSVETAPCALLAHVVRPLRPPYAERMAPEAEDYEIVPGRRLPVSRLPIGDGFDLFDRLALLLPKVLLN